MKYLIVGLGNIGEEYRETRHNIGFMVLDALAKASNIVFSDGRYGATAQLSLKITKRQTIDSAQTIHLHEPEWECSTLLDATRKNPFGKRIDCSR